MTGSASDHSRPIRDVQAGMRGTGILWEDQDVQKHQMGSPRMKSMKHHCFLVFENNF